MTDITRLALVGVGKIARDQHIPAIARSDAFALAATVSLGDGVEGVPHFRTMTEMAASVPDIGAVAICTPPAGRLALVEEAIGLGYDLLLEKPPAATLAEAERIVALAAEAGSVLLLSWHSRDAAAVEPARDWLKGRKIDRAEIVWKEDVRVWHPGQEWIWQPGIGVFDPGINALSVITRLIEGDLIVRASELDFPENKEAPIAARLTLDAGGGVEVDVDFDFDQRGPQSWNIRVECGSDILELRDGASRVFVNGMAQAVPDTPEYDGVYARFADLLARRSSEADLGPLRLVADSFMIGRRRSVSAFAWS